jgi:hypothetical protein
MQALSLLYDGCEENEADACFFYKKINKKMNVI